MDRSALSSLGNEPSDAKWTRMGAGTTMAPLGSKPRSTGLSVRANSHHETDGCLQGSQLGSVAPSISAFPTATESGSTAFWQSKDQRHWKTVVRATNELADDSESMISGNFGLSRFAVGTRLAADGDSTANPTGLAGMPTPRRCTMLILSRKPNQEIVINDNIRIVVTKVSGNRVSIGIEAPADMPILRGECREFHVGIDGASPEILLERQAG